MARLSVILLLVCGCTGSHAAFRPVVSAWPTPSGPAEPSSPPTPSRGGFPAIATLAERSPSRLAGTLAGVSPASSGAAGSDAGGSIAAGSTVAAAGGTEAGGGSGAAAGDGSSDDLPEAPAMMDLSGLSGTDSAAVGSDSGETAAAGSDSGETVVAGSDSGGAASTDTSADGDTANSGATGDLFEGGGQGDSQQVNTGGSDNASTAAAGASADGSADYTLPAAPGGVSAVQVEFIQAASRILRRIHLQNDSDPSIALSLREKLTDEAELSSLRGEWDPLLEKGAAHARALESLGLAVRQLTTAVAGARLDSDLGIYRGLDMVECRSAFQQVKDAGAAAMALVVNMPPLGRQTLKALNIACNDSHSIDLAERSFPDVSGPASTRRQAKKAFRKQLERGRVLKVSIGQRWTKDQDDDNLRRLHATFGVKRRNVFPEHPCLMQQAILSQRRKGKRWGPIECCAIQTTQAIACSLIE